ncbi:MAG: peptidoglycan DD-metalloendopeptidase family protein [Gammaproteobacteria bacterium]|nr:peptidoglycan DD-metalloendopeptidase family protein [Gammaproteobacteria bacterium]MBU1558502.1 peptidoglycan DD-metalloendopeptidase family protein [Gammaproteobacteria bacterium]
MTITSEKLTKAPWKSIKIKQNDTLEKIFKQENLDHKTLYQLMSLTIAKPYLKNLQANHTLYLLVGHQGKLTKLVYGITPYKYLEIIKSKDLFKAQIIEQKLIKNIEEATIQINRTLSQAANQAGFTNSFINSLSKIFENKIDFSSQIKKGDRFKVIYEEYYANNKPIQKGDILAAQYTHKHHNYIAIRYGKTAKTANYYTPDGANLGRRFLRAPVKYTRISSPFNERRMHPILHIIRPHEGVDLAAPLGTPIHATSDGVIAFRSRNGGYGKVIVIKSGYKYSTLYAHMSRFSPQFHLGSHVKLGEVIGYVGQTGLATGPHVHYEFRINGVHYDPMKVKLPHAAPIPKSQRQDFKRYAHQMMALLNTK